MVSVGTSAGTSGTFGSRMEEEEDPSSKEPLMVTKMDSTNLPQSSLIADSTIPLTASVSASNIASTLTFGVMWRELSTQQ